MTSAYQCFYKLFLSISLVLLASPVLGTQPYMSKSQKMGLNTTETDTTPIPDWYISPPSNYEKDGADHYFSVCSGRSYQNALVNCLIGTANDVEFTRKVVKAGESGTTNQILDEAVVISISLDAIEMIGSTFSKNHYDYKGKSSGVENFSSFFRIIHESGDSRFEVELIESEMNEKQGENGQAADGSYIYYKTVTTREQNYGYQKFIEYFKESPMWNIKEKEILSDEYFLLLEYIEDTIENSR